jgi:hypothetical protein
LLLLLLVLPLVLPVAAVWLLLQQQLPRAEAAAH